MKVFQVDIFMLQRLYKSIVVSILSFALLSINMPLMAQVAPLSVENELLLKKLNAERAAIRAALGLSSEFTKVGVIPQNIPELKEERELWIKLKAKAQSGDSEAKQKIAGVDKIVKDLNRPRSLTASVTVGANNQGAKPVANSNLNKSATGYVREKDGTLTKTETHSFSGNKGDDDNMIHSLTMFAVGFVGVKLLSYKKWTPDMISAAVASGLYVSSEIMNVINMKKQLSDVTAQTVKRNDGKMDQAQIEALEKLKASYESAKSSVKMRKNLQTAAAAAFLVASGIATGMQFFEAGQILNCHAGMITAISKLTACAAVTATGAGASEGIACGACAKFMGAIDVAITASRAKSEVPGPSAALATALATIDATIQSNILLPCLGGISDTIRLTFVVPACSASLVTKKLYEAYGLPIPVGVSIDFNGFKKELISKAPTAPSRFLTFDPHFILRNNLKKLVDFVIPRAEAGGVASLLGLGGWAVTALVGLSLSVSQVVDSFLFTPTKRIFLWGSLALAAKLSADSSEKELKKIEDNITKIDKILAEIYTLEKGITASNVGTQSYSVPINTNIDANADTPLFPNDKKAKTDCLTPSCTPIPDTFKGMPEFAGLPDSFKSIASQVTSLGNGLSGTGTLSGATMAGATSLGNNHNAIAKTVGEMKKKLNESLAKNGKAKIDFDKEEKNAWGKMKSGVAKTLQEKGTSASSLLSSMGLSPISSANATPAPAAALAPKKAAVPGGGVVGAGAAPAKGMQFDFKEASAEGGAPDAAAELAAKNEDLDLGSNDINTNSGESIFQVISNRYIKSGYPKLLEEIPVKK